MKLVIVPLEQGEEGLAGGGRVLETGDVTSRSSRRRARSDCESLGQLPKLTQRRRVFFLFCCLSNLPAFQKERETAMRSLRSRSSSAQRPGAGRVAGVRRSVLPPSPMPLLSSHRCRHRLPAVSPSSSGIKNSSAVSFSSPSSSSSLSKAPDSPAPALLPPTGDIKVSGSRKERVQSH